MGNNNEFSQSQIEAFFKYLSKEAFNRVPGVYHPDENLYNLAQENGIFILPVHFYTPIPSKEEIANHSNDKYSTKGIDWNDSVQLEYVDKCSIYEKELEDITFDKEDKYNFYWNNGAFSHTDAIFYYSLIRMLKPQKIIEIGAGNSTKILLKSLKFNNSNPSEILSIIEPYPYEDLQLVAEKYNIPLIEKKIQDTTIDVFKTLQDGDILFYDGSHVSKYGSDVNHFIFNILPELNSGVYIHIHDIFLPTEYPENWIEDMNIFWNEQYIVHAFLQFNSSYEVVFSSNYLITNYKSELDEKFSVTQKLNGNLGGSIWLRKK